MAGDGVSNVISRRLPCAVEEVACDAGAQGGATTAAPGASSVWRSAAVADASGVVGSAGILGSLANVGCAGCVGCIGCINCRGCVGCIGCVGLTGAVGRIGVRA